ncbi:DUF5681 domain-containing protein [Novosphingobium kaempferiae]|uniref:DUF5681 domain-containing protein n=1 Tax=Novosphingobium kaempferiae TaxID=2896849 RepID=UPI001E4C2B4B|nr:DUF5681 domain-containing protein [Novosphingobium kaempferiae]
MGEDHPNESEHGNAGEKQEARHADGRFAPGTSGNPAGKKPGTRHRATRAIEEMLAGEHDKLTRKAIDMALAGDTTAMRLCLDRIAPPRKDAPITFDLPPIKTAADTVSASCALLQAVSEGEVTPDEAGRVMALLTAHKSLVEVGDLEARIAALEEKQA